MKKIRANSAEELKKVAAAMAAEALSETRKQAKVFALLGDLGSGKTTFAQGFAQGLLIKERVLSPTFVLMKEFDIPKTKGKLYHIDAYRLQKEKDLLDLGWSEILENPGSIVLIEWADRVAGILPPNTTRLRFENLRGEERTIFREE